MRRLLFATATALAVAGGCYVGPIETERASLPSDPAEAGAGTPANAGEGGAVASALPCDVQALVTTHCAACHAPPLKAPVRLVTYEDLVAKSASDPGRTLAEVAVGRMRNSAQPMPPAPNAAVPSAAISVLEKWIAAGYPHGTCGAPADADDAGTLPVAPTVCTSGLTWSSGKKGATMNPGKACIACHDAQSDEGPIVQLGGTVYPSFHEPDLCYGVDGTTHAAHVVITDAAGQVFDLPVGPTGNFSKALGGSVVRPPFRAKVVLNGVERSMATPQTSGDCNGCHTVTGANGAPGRITLP